jgi:hypothetical protein
VLGDDVHIQTLFAGPHPENGGAAGLVVRANKQRLLIVVKRNEQTGAVIPTRQSRLAAKEQVI